MNYIKQLQAQIVENDDAILRTKEAIQEFRAHLLSPKFQGVDTDGDRKDWIATADVLARLALLDSLLTD